MAAVEHRFLVMACHASVVLVDAAPGTAAAVRTRLEDLERRWSRFIPDSDIGRINRSDGVPVPVSTDTVTLLRRMADGVAATAGAYDPTMLATIVDLGYGPEAAVAPALPAPAGTVDQVDLDRRRRCVTVPAGLGLDPGGIGKGLAADLAVATALDQGAAGVLVSIGGDLVVAGRPPTGGWIIAVDRPDRPGADLARFRIDRGGVATSSTLSRRWSVAGTALHHAIDPATGTCSTTDLLSATVVARNGWEAEVNATAALLAGSDRCLAYLEQRDLSGLAVTADGAVLATPDLAAAVTVAARPVAARPVAVP